MLRTWPRPGQLPEPCPGILDESTIFASWADWDDWDALSIDRSPSAVNLVPAGAPEYYAVLNPWPPGSAMLRDEWTIDHVVQLAEPSDPGSDRRFGAVGKLQGGIRLLNNAPRVVLGNVPFNGSATPLPDLEIGTARRFWVVWTARPNPAPSGSGDQVISELRVRNLDTGGVASTTFDLPLAPDTATTFLSLGATVVGGLPLGGGDPSILASTGLCRVRTRYFSESEQAEQLPIIASLAGSPYSYA